MKLPQLLLQSASLTAAAVVFRQPPQAVVANPSSTSSQSSSSDHHRIPTSYESAVLGRRILALTPLGTLSTVFPSSSSHAHEPMRHDDASATENRPDGVGGSPVGLMDYIADCEDGGNPTILAIDIATSFKNVRAGSNISLALQWTPPYPPDKRISVLDKIGGLFAGATRGGGGGSDDDDDDDDGPTKNPVPYSAANLPRFSLLGYLEPIDTVPEDELASCFVDVHPDAKYWLPGNRIHASEFVRLVVTQVYWIGGFGDRAYIGWLPIDEWRNITREEWESVRLPGEKKGWKEWATPEWLDL